MGAYTSAKKDLHVQICAKDHVNVSVQTRVKNTSNTYFAGGTACHALAKRAMPECLNNQTISTARLPE